MEMHLVMISTVGASLKHTSGASLQLRCDGVGRVGGVDVIGRGSRRSARRTRHHARLPGRRRALPCGALLRANR